MAEPLHPTPSPGESDPALRPRSAPARHFRKPAENSPAMPGTDPAAADSAASDLAEMERLTTQFKAIAGRRNSPVPEDPAEEETPARRKQLPRSGNINMSVMLGQRAGADGLEPMGSTTEADDRLPFDYDAPQASLPEGFGALMGKLAAVAIVMFGLGYLAASLVSRLSPAPAPPLATSAQPPPAKWSAATIDVLEKALAADRAGDFKEAIRLITELAAKEPTLPGLARYRADVQYRNGNFVESENALRALSDGGREAPQALYLRAFSAARQRRFDDTFRLLQASLALDPLQAEALHQASEVLRRQGRLADAVSLGQEALVRVQPGHGLTRSTIALKIRLAQIEGGQAGEVEAALAEALKSPPVAPEWMFTAAALTLQRGDRSAGGDWLSKARAVMPRDEFNGWVDDYFFRVYTALPELAAFRLSEEDRRRRQTASWDFFIDP